MWGKIIIPMYWLWLHGLYGLYGPRCPLSPKRLINLISPSLEFQVKLHLGNGRPDCHEAKGTGVDRMLCRETLRKWVNWTLHWLGYLWPWPLTLNFDGQIVSREWEVRLSWNERDGSQWDVLIWNTKEMSQLDTVLTGVSLTLTLTLNFESQIVSREWEARLSWNERDGIW